ncbi:hypothetical protein ASF49_08280 [Methylobacterium sp. Leaf104]|nr:hypothetical protein ASF49_08280 [Methylobacterium sp. Leaf104]
MLTKLLQFAGLTPAPQPPARPLSRRSDKPVGPRPTKPAPVSDVVPLTPAEQAVRDAVKAEQRAATLARQAEEADKLFARSIGVIVRHHNPAREMETNAKTLADAERFVGPEVLEFLRAMRLAAVPVPFLGPDLLLLPHRCAAYRIEFTRLRETSVEDWDRAWLASLRERSDATKIGETPPPELDVPGPIQEAIAKAAAEKAARLAKRIAGGTGTTGTTGAGGNAGATGTAVIPPGTTGSKDPKDATEEEPETYVPPGPK